MCTSTHAKWLNWYWNNPSKMKWKKKTNYCTGTKRVAGSANRAPTCPISVLLLFFQPRICFLTSVWPDSRWCEQCSCRLPNSPVRRGLKGGQERWRCGSKTGGSFAGQLAVKARQANGKGLKSTHRVVVVQREDVFSHSAKLHDNVVS